MYLNSSYDFTALKAVYYSILHEIELGHANWGQDFQDIESLVLVRHNRKIRGAKNVAMSSLGEGNLRPRPSFRPPGDKLGKTQGDEQVFYCRKFQSNKCPQKGAHLAVLNGKNRMVKHICATCLLTDHKEVDHPECDTSCPNQS